MLKANDTKIKLDEDYCLENIYMMRDNNPEYQEASKKYKAIIEGLEQHIKIDDAVCFVEAVSCDIVYKKGFHDGMRFILNAIAGKEVIEI